LENIKKKVLILGYSSIVKRRILPAIIKTKNIKFEICSVSSKKQHIGESNWYRNYNQALKQSKADIVYISLPNSEHFKWAKKALIKGFHVVIDKPATINLKEAKRLIKIAKMKKRLLAEALVYSYHGQVIQGLKLVGGLKLIDRIHANFNIPTPNKNSIRSIKKLKSYCIYDMLPYAASIIRIFCKGKLIKIGISSKKYFHKKFSFILEFSNMLYTGHFCYGGEYQNNLTLFSKKKVIKLNRVFAPPPNERLNLEISSKNKSYTIKTQKDDTFYNFFRTIFSHIKSKRYSVFLKKLEQDSRIREMFISEKKI
jgi:predicted dehydrogenase